MLMENVVAQMLVASGRKPYFYSRIDPSNADERMEIDFLLSKTKTGRRKNIIPLEVKSAKRFTQISLNKFCGKFSAYIDHPMVLASKTSAAAKTSRTFRFMRPLQFWNPSNAVIF